MLDLGNSFRASVERDPDAVAIVDGAVRLTYAQWYARISGLVGGLRRDRAKARRPSCDAAAEPLGSRDAALGLPVRRHRHHAGQLARQSRRDRLLSSRMPRPRPSPSRRCRREAVRGSGEAQEPAAHRARRRRTAARSPSTALLASGRARRRAARRRRSLVGDALHLRHHGAAEGRAAPPARRTRRRGRACGTESLRARRTHARRHAALSHHGRALAARDVADRRRFRLPAALRAGQALELIAAEKHQQSLSGADALSRPCSPSAVRRERRQLGAQARLCRRADDRRPAQEAYGGIQARAVRQSLRLVGNLHLHHRPERAGESPARPAAPASTSGSAW